MESLSWMNICTADLCSSLCLVSQSYLTGFVKGLLQLLHAVSIILSYFLSCAAFYRSVCIRLNPCCRVVSALWQLKNGMCYCNLCSLFDAGVEAGADVRNACQRAGSSCWAEGFELHESGTRLLRTLAARIQSFGPLYFLPLDCLAYSVASW